MTEPLAPGFLPGLARAITLNLIGQGRDEEALTYLLGVVDALVAIGHPQAHEAINVRKALRIRVRGE